MQPPRRMRPFQLQTYEYKGAEWKQVVRDPQSMAVLRSPYTNFTWSPPGPDKMHLTYNPMVLCWSSQVVYSASISSPRSSTSLEQALMRYITLILSIPVGNTQNLRTSKKPLLESQDAKRSQKCLTKLTHSLTRRERKMSSASH